MTVVPKVLTRRGQKLTVDFGNFSRQIFFKTVSKKKIC